MVQKIKYADNLKQVVENKKGTAADLNILLASMLEKVDVPSTYGVIEYARSRIYPTTIPNGRAAQLCHLPH